nr:hypothetical protein [Halomicroarcula marina]
MANRSLRLTDAYSVGIKLHRQLRGGSVLTNTLTALEGPFETLEDGYPEWHPAPYPFHGMLRLFLYREITGQSYRSLTQYAELVEVFGIERIPDESVLSRTWRNRFANAVERQLLKGKTYGDSKKHPDTDEQERLYGWWLGG